MTSMKEIAKICGVSVATVSKALNNQDDIGDATKLRIQKVAEEMGYTANIAARALKTNRTNNIGILFRDNTEFGLAHAYFASILESFKKEMEKSGYDVTFITNSVNGKKSSYLNHCLYRGFDGVAIMAADFNDPEVMRLVKSDLPVVTLDYMYDDCSAIISDNTRGLEALVRYAYERGHRRIAFIHGEMTSVTDLRLMSFKKAVQDLKLDIPEEYVREGVYHDISNCKHITRELLELNPRPTCIIFPDDYAYIGGLQAINEKGLSIPEDISTIGYDGIDMARVLHLTTYRQNAERLGKVAAQRLISQINNPSTVVEHTIVTGQLVEGRTVKDLNLNPEKD